MNHLPVWKPLRKPGEISETRLINAILDGTFPINSLLPGERDLAALLGVTRPTLREAMQRLERDGWLDIRHGKPTRVRDFWREGKLGVSITMAQQQASLPADYVVNLLSVRVLLAPDYVSSAVEKKSAAVLEALEQTRSLTEDALEFTRFDWQLHWLLTIHSGNPFYTHFINSVQPLYDLLGEKYFRFPQTRAHSRSFYDQLKLTAEKGEGMAAEALTKRVMRESRDLWLQLVSEGDRILNVEKRLA